MKPLKMILLLSPLLFTGCLLLPSTEPHKQTVQRGNPPPVDPKLPGAKGGKLMPEEQNDSSARPRSFPLPPSGLAPVTPDQVTKDNAHQMTERLYEEIERDSQNQAGPGAKGNSVSESWPN